MLFLVNGDKKQNLNTAKIFNTKILHMEINQIMVASYSIDNVLFHLSGHFTNPNGWQVVGQTKVFR